MNTNTLPTDDDDLGLHIRNVPAWAVEALGSEAREQHRSRQAHIRAVLMEHARRYTTKVNTAKSKTDQSKQEVRNV